MPVKTPAKMKELARQKLREGMSQKEVADFTGMSLRSVGRIKSIMDGKSAMPPRKARKEQEAPPASTQETQTGKEQGPGKIDFVDSPANPDKKGGIEGAWASLKGMIGLGDKEPGQTVLPVELSPRAKKFVESASPALSLAFMALAKYLWSQFAGNYAEMLAPDEKTARRIVEPLIRVYARHADFLMDINPDIADVGASMFALVGYVNVSMRMYQEIKEKELEAQNGTQPAAQFNANGINVNRSGGGHWRNFQPAQTENGTGNTGSRYADVFRGSREHDSSVGTNDGNTSDIGELNLTDAETRQYQALSRLSQLDYQHRARRSGKP